MIEVNLSIDVPKLDDGVRFYREVFGWTERARPFPTMAVLDGGNVTVCVHEKPAGSKPTLGEAQRDYARHWTPVHIDVHVRDFESVLARALAHGAVVEARFERPKPTAFCADPFGHGFCLIGDGRG